MLPRAKDVIGRKRPELLVEPAIAFDEVLRRLATSAEIPRAAMHGTTTAFAAAVLAPRCPSRVLASPVFDRLEPVPAWHQQYEADVLERWNDLGFDLGDVANGVVIAARPVRPGTAAPVRRPPPGDRRARRGPRPSTATGRSSTSTS